MSGVEEGLQGVLIAPLCCKISSVPVCIPITEVCVPSLLVSSGASKLVLLSLPICYSHKYSTNNYGLGDRVREISNRMLDAMIGNPWSYK
jgi:hypothetical protein